jgi:hypothetical protein
MAPQTERPDTGCLGFSVSYAPHADIALFGRHVSKVLALATRFLKITFGR